MSDTRVKLVSDIIEQDKKVQWQHYLHDQASAETTCCKFFNPVQWGRTTRKAE